MKTLMSFLNEGWIEKAEIQKEEAYGQPPRKKALHMWNHHTFMMRHHEAKVNHIAQTMMKLHAEDDDRVKSLGDAELDKHKKHIAQHKTERAQYRWALE